MSPAPPTDPDSRARTHLANERTFLAWFRTGLTLIALALAAGQFLQREMLFGLPLVPTLSTLLALAGVALAAIGARRYLAARERIEAQAFRPANLSVLWTTAAAVAAGILAIVFVWLLDPL